MAITKNEDGGHIMVTYGEDGRPISSSRVDNVSQYMSEAMMQGSVAELGYAGDAAGGSVDQLNPYHEEYAEEVQRWVSFEINQDC